nr:MAG TPA: hypothetical protein [Caudoviricetes sp.]
MRKYPPIEKNWVRDSYGRYRIIFLVAFALL